MWRKIQFLPFVISTKGRNRFDVFFGGRVWLPEIVVEGISLFVVFMGGIGRENNIIRTLPPPYPPPRLRVKLRTGAAGGGLLTS